MSGQTLRQAMFDMLCRDTLESRDLSQALSIPEKEVYSHLPHVRRSARAQGRSLIIEPARCLACGYQFKGRQRVTPPGRCPQCRGTRMARPAYRIE
ncbi:MAG: transcriptional regulator [Desulfobacterales bacterium]